VTLEAARAVADAVLYEGYLLYPYRASATKNQVRWQFGVLGPPACPPGEGEPPTMATDCLLEAAPMTAVGVHLRFLQLQDRQVERATPGGGFEPVAELATGPQTLRSWEEAVDRSVELGPITVEDLARGVDLPVAVAGGIEVEAVAGGRVVRRRWPITAGVQLRAEAVTGHPGIVRLAVEVTNGCPDAVADRRAATRRSLLGAHVLLVAHGGRFVSLLEPPEELAEVAAACRHDRCWPVLAGAPGEADVALCSPIILYDHPEVAPQSPGDLFDATEIDEILTLRILTMTDEEKAEARATDPAAAAIIDRCEGLGPEDLARLHGTLRDPHRLDDVPTWSTPPGDGPAPGAPWWDPGVDASVSPTTDTVVVRGVRVGAGSKVRLRPSLRADAQDLFFTDRVATVSAVLFDVDGATYVAVTVDDDPGADLQRTSGRFLYFAPDEVEPLDQAASISVPADHEEDRR
jgi:hypothetical protein